MCLGEINKLPLDPTNLAHMALSYLLLPTNISNLRNSKLKVIDLVGLYFADEGSSIELCAQFVNKLPNECGWIGDKISSNSPTIDLVLFVTR
jgi:hypothetical protein